MRSLAFATDVAVLLASGSAVDPADGCRVVRTPSNPGYRWGNFLLLDAAPEAGSVERWRAEHARRFPGSGFTTLGVDDAHPSLDEEEWRSAGFDVDRCPVLTAHPSDVRTDRGAPRIRAARSDDDWDGVLAVHRGNADGDEDAFLIAHVAALRALVDRGVAEWLLVDDGGRAAASAGLVDCGDGLGRYQEVNTLPAFRRRGYASALVVALAAVAERMGCTRLVMVAESAGPAADLYRGVGFRDTEEQLLLERVDGAGADPPAAAGPDAHAGAGAVSPAA